ncbi:hypothetical protein HD598_001457 [Neomicrococcus aestuarii]|uniref:Uncharacterized protein n=1 Tax=Neomicrococcus aestuarii TaxID=556325 RepID=A0A7W8TVA8_9MICC|nr:hypothetical protein [Neomicrococcus aestuarii]MBB5512770.1 hypothetical protein [Neomicrococcus aestuarii]
MSHHDSAETSRNSKPSRRRVVSAAAWSAPVIAAAGVAPFAAASTHSLLVGWADIYNQPLVGANLALFDATVDASVLEQRWPQTIRFTNPPTASSFTGPLTAQVTIAFTSGIAAIVSTGSYVGLTVNSVTSPSGTAEATIAGRSTTDNGSNPDTTNTFIDFGNHTIAPGASIDFAVTYRLAENAVTSLNALTTYSATVTAYEGTYAALGTSLGSETQPISALVLAGVLQ